VKKEYYKHLPKRQREELESYVPAVTKVINEWDYLNVLDSAPQDHYEREIYAICFHMGLMGKNRLDFLTLSQIIYVEMAHSFSLLEISEKMCLEPASALVIELESNGD
jgi:hypothetical protein